MEGKSSRFVEYMLSIIDNSLDDVIAVRSRKLSGVERLKYFLDFTENEFSRKDYLNVFNSISTATASRDLKQGVELRIIRKTGTRNKTKYKGPNGL